MTRRKFFTRALVALAAGVCGVVGVGAIKKKPTDAPMFSFRGWKRTHNGVTTYWHDPARSVRYYDPNEGRWRALSEDELRFLAAGRESIRAEHPEYTMVSHVDETGQCVKKQRVQLRPKEELDWMFKMLRIRKEQEGKWL